MIEIKFKECCNYCKHLDTYVETNNIFADNDRIANTTIIGCNHEKVCCKYLAKKKDKQLEIGRVYEIIDSNFLFKYPDGRKTNEYARGVLQDYWPDNDRGIAELRLLNNDNIVEVSTNYLKEVPE